jgi:hypothetical protein
MFTIEQLLFLAATAFVITSILLLTVINNSRKTLHIKWMSMRPEELRVVNKLLEEGKIYVD